MKVISIVVNTGHYKK